MEKKTLINQQIVIILYLLAAAVSCIEATVQFQIDGWKSWKFYVLVFVFLFSSSMYFIKKKQRLSQIHKKSWIQIGLPFHWMFFDELLNSIHGKYQKYKESSNT